MACAVCGDPGTADGQWCQPCKDATDKLIEDAKDSDE